MSVGQFIQWNSAIQSAFELYGQVVASDVPQDFKDTLCRGIVNGITYAVERGPALLPVAVAVPVAAASAAAAVPVAAAPAAVAPSEGRRDVKRAKLSHSFTKEDAERLVASRQFKAGKVVGHTVSTCDIRTCDGREFRIDVNEPDVCFACYDSTQKLHFLIPEAPEAEGGSALEEDLEWKGEHSAAGLFLWYRRLFDTESAILHATRFDARAMSEARGPTDVWHAGDYMRWIGCENVIGKFSLRDVKLGQRVRGAFVRGNDFCEEPLAGSKVSRRPGRKVSGLSTGRK
jgi:hypothetical protein